MQDELEAVAELAEALGGPIGERELERVHAAALRGELALYVERQARIFRDGRQSRALREEHQAFLGERNKLAKALSARLVKVISSGDRTVEMEIPLRVDKRTGRIIPDDLPPLPRGESNCLHDSSQPAPGRLVEFLKQLGHVPPQMEAFATEPEPIHCGRHPGGHLAGLVFLGLVLEEEGLKPCPCQMGTPHRFKVVDVRLRVGPWLWTPGTLFDSPCPEAEEDLSKYKGSGMVVDLQAKKEKAPTEPSKPSAEDALRERLGELAPEVQGDAEAGGGPP